MSAPCDLTIMVPALNVGRRLESTLSAICRALKSEEALRCEVVVINDGSTDDTGQIAERLAKRHEFVRAIHHAVNQGLGASFRETVTFAAGRKFLIVPADNDLSADTLTLLLRHLDSADLVMCFFLNREARGRWRNLLSDFFALIYATAFDVHVQYLNGPSVFPTRALRDLDLVSRRFSIVAEAHIKLLRQGVTFLEIPGYMQTGTAGSSAVTFKALWETVRVFLQLLWEVQVSSRQRFSRRPQRIARCITLSSILGMMTVPATLSGAVFAFL